MDKTGELFLDLLNNIMEGDNGLCFNLMLLLSSILGFALKHFDKFCLILLDSIPGDVSQLSVFSDLVWRSGAEWFSIDIDHGLLPHVDPDNLARLGIDLATGLVESIFKSRGSWLSAAVDFVPGNPM